MPRLDLNQADAAALDRLLDEALDLEPTQRDAWLAELPETLGALKPLLRDLLSRTARVETEDFLATLPKMSAGIALQPHTEESLQPGASIGVYRLIRELGKGGMGSVWLAERIDGLINRTVALKLPHGPWVHEGLAERLIRERDILASLEHPNIARLYDAGLAANGRPFLALEFVEGQPLDSYAKSIRADELTEVAVKLRLFSQAAHAVAYAHSKLVLHRDLKPANILVTDKAEVRLLDFGIAKLLTQDRAQETQLTQYSGRALSPEYASPEQIVGEPLSIASDVYSLGVVLFELLAGTRPYKLTRVTRAALEEAILHAEPQRLSDAAPARLRRILRGDLDTIVLKALKKDSRERYATVNALVEDISRYLDNRPVLARPDSNWYRMRKFVSRNRVGVAGAATVSTAIVAAAVVSVWQARVAIRQKERAQEVQHFIETIFGNANPNGDVGRTMSAVDLLRSARAEVDRAFSGRKDLRITLLDLIGSSVTGLSEFSAAESALRAALQDSLDLYGPNHIVTVRTRALLAEIHAAQLDKTALRADLKILLPLARAQRSVDAEPLVRALKDQGYLAFAEGRVEEIVPPVQESFAIARLELGDRHPLTVEVSTLLAESYLESYDLPVEEALRQARRALQFAFNAYGEHSDHMQVIRAREMHARALGNAGSYSEAIEQQLSALAALGREVGFNNRMAVDVETSLSQWERRVGAIADSVVHGDEALKTLELLGDTHSADYASVLGNQGLNLLTARRLQEAQAMLERAEPLHNELYGPTHWNTLTTRLNLAMTRANDGQSRGALSALDVLNTPDLKLELPWWIAYVRGTVARLTHQAELAVAEQSRALALIPDVPRKQWERVRVLTELGQAQLDLGLDDAGNQTLTQAWQLNEMLKVRMYPAYAETLVASARVDLKHNAPEQALPKLERADTYWQQFDANNREAGEAALWLARAYRQLGQTEAANAAAARATRIRSRI